MPCISILIWRMLEQKVHPVSLATNEFVLKIRDLHIWTELSSSLTSPFWVQDIGESPVSSAQVVVEDPGTGGGRWRAAGYWP